MRFKTKLKSDTGEHELDVDLSHVHMTSEQRAIADKLFRSVQNETIDVRVVDPCEVGKCLASKHLPPDEFAKIRGLKAELASNITPNWIIIDFCIHPVVHKN
jgi:hypothetical protein